MKKRLLPNWMYCLILVAATLLFNLRFWLPITEESGEHFTLTLESAEATNSYIILDFGKVDSFHIVNAASFDGLLEEDALGKEYEIIAQYRWAKRNSRRYYDVYALSCTDGTTYLTLEQSEAIRQAMLPQRLLLTLALDAVCCVTFIISRKKRDAAAARSAAAAPEQEESL